MYMLSYISKPEHEMNYFLKNVIKGVRETNVNEEDEMKNIMQAYSKHRQVSAQESVARTCSLPVKKCSRNVVFIPTDDDALKMSLPLSALHNKDPDSEDVWMSGMIDKYRARPRTLEFEIMCLADFVSNYRVVYGRQTKGKNVHRLLNDMGFIQKRTVGKAAIIRYAQFSEEKQPDKHYGRLVKLYMPHRFNEQLKPQRYPTYQEFYKGAFVELPAHPGLLMPVCAIVKSHQEKYEKHSKEVDEAFEKLQREGPSDNAWTAFAPEIDVDPLECIVEQDVDPEGNSLDEVRAGLRDVEILIIDEVSMISKDMFAYINWRFQQIKGSKKPFGGISCLAVGDYYQLPPLEIMRQKEDLAFAELLNRLRVKQKTEALREDDRALLLQAVKNPEDCPHIFATNIEVLKYNTETVQALYTDIITIDAEDYRKDPKTGGMKRLNKPVTGKKDSLLDTIEVAVGVCVMVTRNLDVEDGIVNWCFGKIANIVTKTKDGITTVQMLGLQLDNPNAGQKHRKKVGGEEDVLVYIERFEENLRKGAVRRQFPIKLAYAHKVQGITMQSAVVSLKKIFEPGMAYVALSRTTSLHGLHITDFDDKKKYADPKITASLQAMRRAPVEEIMPLLQHAENKEERRLLLAIESGRINARPGSCPIVGCGRFCNRLDRHIHTHSEISAVVQVNAVLQCKRRVVISKLTALRASNPAVPMVSTLDLEEHQHLEDPNVPPDQEELEEEECSNPGCATGSLRGVDPFGRCPRGSCCTKAPLLSSLGPEEEDVASMEEVLDAPVQTTTPGESSTRQQPKDGAEEPSASDEQPSSSTREPREKSPPQYPDHVSVLNEILEENRGHNLGPDPTPELRENVGCQICRIKKFIAFMAEGKGDQPQDESSIRPSPNCPDGGGVWVGAEIPPPERPATGRD
ncbi:ATP-dependent DNA helicase PIF1-like protein [Labeo rohita]|uniref:ATP-dependent DNA helicase n=1 Tax=Labeo rohita TaxID=84645 RepID=A0A498M1G7_LABRO|nr:ATP-dependent DNA helicase PIF1-like protein [Labeo rohita]